MGLSESDKSATDGEKPTLPSDDMGDFLLIFAPNGSFPTPQQVNSEYGGQANQMHFAHTPETLADEAISALEFGAGMFHIHPRLTGQAQSLQLDGKTHLLQPGDPAPDYRFFTEVKNGITELAASKGDEFAAMAAGVSYENSVSVLSNGNILDKLSKHHVGPIIAGASLGVAHTDSITLTSPTDVPNQSTAMPEFRVQGVWQWARPERTFDYDSNSTNWVWGQYFKEHPELESFYKPKDLAVAEGHSYINPVVNFFHRCVREMDINFTLEQQAPRMMYVWEEMLERGMLKSKQLNYEEWEEKVRKLGVYDAENGKTWLDRARELAPKKWDPREPLEKQKFFEMHEGFVQMLFGHEVFYPVKTPDGKQFNEQFVRDELDWMILKFQPHRMSMVGAWIYDEKVFKDYLNFATTYKGPGGRQLDALRVGHEHIPPSPAGAKGSQKPDINVEFDLGNSAQVAIAAEIARSNGRKLVSPEQTNAFLGYITSPNKEALFARQRYAIIQQPFVDKLMGRATKSIALVGAGDAGTSIMDALAHSNVRDIEITIFEKAPVAGPGIPYSEKFNLKTDKMNLQGNETFRDQRDYFMEWVRKQPDQRLLEAGILHTLKSEAPELLKRYEEGGIELKELLVDHWVYPRILVGEFLKDLFQNSVRTLEARGCKVTTHLSTEVTDATKVDGKWQLDFTDANKTKKSISAESLILACGYSAQKGNDKPGYFPVAYPAQKIMRQADLTKTIGQIGSNVFGGEVPTKFDAGSYERQPDGSLKFAPYPGNENFHIKIFSRTGMFPAVKGYTDNYHAIFLTEEAIRNLISWNRGFLPLDNLTDLFKKEVAHAAPELAAAYPGWENLKFEEVAQVLQKEYATAGGRDILAKNIALARESRNTKTPIPWQNPLMLTFVWLDQYLNKLSGEDRLRWDRSFDTITKSIMLLQIDVAEKLLALMDVGAVEIVRVPQGVKVAPNDGHPSGASVVIRRSDSPDESEHFATVIQAGGTHPNVHYSSSPLIQSLARQGYLRPALLPFYNQPYGQMAYSASTSGQIVLKNGQYFYNAGGVEVDDNYQIPAIDSSASKTNLYANFPDTHGNHPIGGGLTHNRHAGKTIVSSITEQDLKVVTTDLVIKKPDPNKIITFPIPSWVRRIGPKAAAVAAFATLSYGSFVGAKQFVKTVQGTEQQLINAGMVCLVDPQTSQKFYTKRPLVELLKRAQNSVNSRQILIASSEGLPPGYQKSILKDGCIGSDNEIGVCFKQTNDGNFDRIPITKDNFHDIISQLGRLTEVNRDRDRS